MLSRERAQHMTKSELIEGIAAKYTHLPARDIEEAIKLIFERMISVLEAKQRIEIRGFGSFSLRSRKPRQGRNPKTGAKVTLLGKCVPHFKLGKALRERINQATLVT